jgi:hypothetical protein
LTRSQVTAWLKSYGRAWCASGTAGLAELFTENATYQLSPYDEPIAGLAAIAAMWERERTGPDERFTMSSEIVALDTNVAVVRIEVHYDGPPPRQYRDLWVIRFDETGRCEAFEEWPFWPERPRVAAG